MEPPLRVEVLQVTEGACDERHGANEDEGETEDASRGWHLRHG